MNWVAAEAKLVVEIHIIELTSSLLYRYKPSFLPHRQQNNMTEKDGELSPLIECPCTDRITRSVVEVSKILTTGDCGASALIASEAACTAAVRSNGAAVSASSTIHDATKPAGCVMVPDAKPAADAAADAVAATTPSYQAIFNTASTGPSGSAAPCGGDLGPHTWEGPMNGTTIDCAAGGCLASDPKYGCTGEFNGQCTWDSPAAARKNCDAYGSACKFTIPHCVALHTRTPHCNARS